MSKAGPPRLSYHKGPEDGVTNGLERDDVTPSVLDGTSRGEFEGGPRSPTDVPGLESGDSVG